MKRIIYILILLFLVACSKSKSYKQELDFSTNENNIKPIEESFKHEFIVKQKLQDYFDLIELKEEYPEFDNQINLQLADLLKDSTNSNIPYKSVSIENLKQIKKQRIAGDSIVKLTLSFDIITSENTVRDTILAAISKSKVHLDDKVYFSTKVTFEKNKE